MLEEPIQFDNHHARLFVPPLHLVDLGEGADNDNVAGIWCAQLTQPAFEPRVILVMAKFAGKVFFEFSALVSPRFFE